MPSPPFPPPPSALAPAQGGAVLQLDLHTRSAALHGQPLNLPGRSFELLAALASQAGQTLTAEQLVRAVWPTGGMSDSNLRVQVNALRKRLGNEAISNLPGRGYRLVLPATVKAFEPRCNLPRYADDLLGRDDDGARLLALLRQQRLVALLGAGGIGKTRLAHQVAFKLLPQMAAGAVWVDLAPLRQGGSDPAAGIAKAIAQAAGVQGQGLQGAEAGPRLAAALAGFGSLLLLLDNAEHLTDTLAPLLRQLLQGAEDVRVLLTSQQALPLPECWAYWLEPLALPPADADAEQALASPAVQLLLRCARSADQRYRADAAELPLAAQVVRTLDGLPLAITLAAARLPLLGMGELQRRLAGQLHWAGRGDPGSSMPSPHDSRHRTLHSTLEWSFGLLSPAERAALRQLSVFAAPFRPGTAAQVIAVDELDEAARLQTIQALADRSLLQVQRSAQDGGPPRLRLLESTRLFAAEALRHGGVAQRQALLDRHAAVMATLAEQACSDFYTASDTGWVLQWLPDFEDFMQAFDHAHSRGDGDTAAPLVEAMVLGANITGQVGPALARWQATRALADTASPLARARLLGWGSMAGSTEASSRRDQAASRVQAWRQAGEARGLCLALAMQAVVCEETGDPAAADAALAECEALQHPLWPPRLRRRCAWLALTRMAIHRGDPALYAQAQALSQVLIQQLEREGARRECTLVQSQLALMLRLQSQPLQAVALLQQTAQAQQALGCELDAGRSLGFACAAWLEHDEQGATADADASGLPHARQAAGQALRLQAAHPTDIHHFIEALAWLACRQDDAATAALLLAGGEALRQRLQVARNLLDERLAARTQAYLDRLPGGPRAAWPTADHEPGAQAGVLAAALRQRALAALQGWA